MELRDDDNFGAFKNIDENDACSDVLGSALAGIVKLTADRTAAKVSPDNLMRLLPASPSAEWLAAFGNMVTVAAKHGWVDVTDESIG